ncbi:MAG: MFS transporter [Desulfocapsaceae bacterium]|jgi:predicted MFS family arabinose efflux permease|nr:MFS transporter [Desulfocapsaceae bacterium]
MDKKSIALPLSITLFVQAIVSMVAVTVPVLAPSASVDLGISAAYAGIYVSLMYVGGMLTSLWSGDFILRYGALRVSQAALFLTGCGLIIASLATVEAMIISAVVIGLGYGPVTPASSHILVKNTPARMMSFVFSLKQTGVPIGGALAGAVVPPLVIFAGWRNALVYIGMFTVGVVLLIIPFRQLLDNDRQPGRRISFRGVTEPLQMVISHRPLRRLAVISFLYAGMQLCLFTYLVIYLTEDVGMAFIAAGLTLSAAQISGTFGRIIWGVLADRYITPRNLLGLLGIGMSLGALATALIRGDWPLPAVIIVTVLFGATAIGWNGVYLAEAARCAPEGKVSGATGGTLFFTFFGVVLGPPIFGGVTSVTGSYSLAFLFFAGLTLFGGILTLADRSEHNDPG